MLKVTIGVAGVVSTVYLASLAPSDPLSLLACVLAGWAAGCNLGRSFP